MQRQFRLTCRRTIDVQKAAPWSNNLVITTETARVGLVLNQPQSGKTPKLPLRCSTCGTPMTVTIRSEDAIRKRRALMWSFALFGVSMTIGCYVALFRTDNFLWLLGMAVCGLASGIPIYHALPSQLRATIYDKDGHFMFPEENGHELEEVLE